MHNPNIDHGAAQTIFRKPEMNFGMFMDIPDLYCTRYAVLYSLSMKCCINNGRILLSQTHVHSRSRMFRSGKPVCADAFGLSRLEGLSAYPVCSILHL